MPDSFDRFTEGARCGLALAQEEAQRLNHSYIGTEHLLLGLIRDGDGVAAKVLSSLGLNLVQVRSRVESIINIGPQFDGIGLTPRSKKVIELAVDEARRLGRSNVGTEHILVALVREGQGIAAGVLNNFLNDRSDLLEAVRAEGVRIRSQEASS